MKTSRRVKTSEYREHLMGSNLSAEAVEARLALVDALVGDLAAQGLDVAAAGKAEAVVFARRLIAEGRNTLENLAALADYAEWLGQRTLYVAWLELMDCHNALAVLADEIEARHGPDVRARIFREALPPLGADEAERCAYTRAVTERTVREITPAEARTAWFHVQHGIPAAAWRRSDETDRALYRQCADLDAFLAAKRRDRDALLTRLHDENKLWYTVEITDEVLAFITSDPEMEGGRREGDRVYITKVPYNAVGYLHATDPRMKRYYACHCPLVREAILRDEPISADVCACSLGHASHYLAGLGLELHGEVLESAVKGDTRCRFVFYLPEEKG